MFKISGVIGIVVVVQLTALATVLAKPGDLDFSVTTDFVGYLDVASSLALQADGKIVVAGSSSDGFRSRFALARYNPSGDLDPTFGGDGKVATQLGEFGASASAIVIQPDGKIVVAGYAEFGAGTTAFALVRYLADGRLDQGFGNGGIATTPVSDSRSQARAVSLCEDGKIILAGYAVASQQDLDFALVRYDPNGNPDPTFGNAGAVISRISSGNDVISSVSLQGDGRIVVAGYSGTAGTAQKNVTVARYDVDGTLDSSFDQDGIRIEPNYPPVGQGPSGEAGAVLVLPDGEIAVAGGGRGTPFVMTFATDGALRSFVASTLQGFATSLVLEPTGNLLVGGRFLNNNGGVLFRYLRASKVRDSEFDVATPNPVVSMILDSEAHVVAVGGYDFNMDFQVSWHFARRCHDGVVDADEGEQCDQANANGAPSSCCTSTCHFRDSGALCRAADGVCDIPEMCSGASGTCPFNFKSIRSLSMKVRHSRS